MAKFKALKDTVWVTVDDFFDIIKYLRNEFGLAIGEYDKWFFEDSLIVENGQALSCKSLNIEGKGQVGWILV